MEPLKEMFNAAYYHLLAAQLKSLVPTLNKKHFVDEACRDLDKRSLNERLRYTSLVLHRFIPGSFGEQLKILYPLAKKMPSGYTALVYPDFVAQFGLQDPKRSLPALKYFTVFGSSEFAIRFFLKEDLDATLKVMESWSKDKDPHVRRLASEGSRPRLPWSFKLDAVLKNPALTATILENLKSDAELYVRKSVANHLNDLSKDHREYMLSIISKWDVDDPHTGWIMKHAARTLVKKGDQAALKVLRFDTSPAAEIRDFKLSANVRIGEKLEFSFRIQSLKKTSQRLVIDYCIHYVRENERKSAKVFKLKNIDLQGNEGRELARAQTIKDFSTRTHHAGKHLLELLVNGRVLASKAFLLEK